MTRDEVIKALECHLKTTRCKGCPYIEERECEVKLCDDAIDMLKAEPKRGRWIINADGEWECSECGCEPLVYEGTPFCPNCGAIMEVDA